MNKNNILLLLFVLFIAGCASFKPQYKESIEQKDFPDQEKILKTFYLIGDVGKSPMGGKSDGLLALESYLQNQSTEKDHLIFLGDNIYPNGMPKKDSDYRPIAENHLNAQIEVAKIFNGTTVFIPGNHDWYDEGLDNVEREKEYIEKALDDKDIWKPKVGCPIESIDLSKRVQLIIVDSQWYLAQWNQHPTINDDCEEIKTREEFFLEVEGELKKNQDKTIVFALHHPLYTNGIHGGQYAAVKHLYPSQEGIPVPILGSLVSQIRTSGGVSAQDKQNKRYQEMVNRITALARASTASRLIFASGHEHTLQYIENDGIRQIVSGSGSKKGYASLSYDGLFSYGGNGFVRLDVMEDGSSWVRYYGFEGGKEKLLFTHKAIETPESFDMESLPEEYPAFAKASVYDQERVEKGDVFESVWGTKYRDLYGTKINAKVALLDTLKGGLTVERAGGGHQTRSLRVTDKQGREYNFRALKKSAVQFLQTTVFKENDVAEGFEDTTAEDLLFDFYTAAHPYAFTTLPTLSNAVGVYHTNPEIYYLPKQKALGQYNRNYGDELYMLVERPEENHDDLASFGKPGDIESTSDLFAKLREDERFKVDQPFYVRARMFDMLIGDWDRHQDQWRWAQFKDEEGNSTFKAIPRDRDQAYSNFDGAIFATLRVMVGLTNQFATYDKDLDNVKWFNTAAAYLDRSIAQGADREIWLSQARHIQENLTDEVIEEAFRELPEEIYPHPTTQTIITSMKARRDKLVDIADRYYDYLAQLGIMTGTDKDDFVIIDRIADGKTKVTIYRNKGGEKAEIVSQRTFLAEETDEIWIYALDDDDIIQAMGDGRNRIKIRIIGGQNNDIYDLENGKGISIYDHKTKDNTFKNVKGARIRLSDDYDRNLYNPKKSIINSNILTPAFGFNPDDGFKIGVQNIYTVNGFNRNPNTRVHKLTAGYYFATQGFDINYEGTFAGIFNHMNLTAKARFAAPTFAENFFGFGNETVNNDDEIDFDFNRVRISEYSGGLGVSYVGEYGSNIRGGIEIQGFEVEDDSDRFITELFGDESTNPDFYDRKWFVDINGGYFYQSYDNKLNPTRGMIFEFFGGFNINTDQTDDFFAYLKPKLGFHNALNRKRNLVLRTLAQATVNFGDDFQFYQSAQIGQDTGLRGYRRQRFSGESSFATSADVRFSFKEFKTGLIPLQMGIFAGGDVGRVWLDGEDSSRWHNDVGGGFWVNSTDAIGATFNLFTGADGPRFSFQVGFSF
ncbi:metallophosphoesterase [Nonlabens xiamenensis]|uniref:metallophosphoesterase n=1 Tax=Nonlabens xiamenensis TaxID=2341043 RepID=UPI000F610C73|nr:metallophosphoesterase [Nonlabens xiamenensis]